jgi:hypothetical protein
LLLALLLMSACGGSGSADEPSAGPSDEGSPGSPAREEGKACQYPDEHRAGLYKWGNSWGHLVRENASEPPRHYGVLGDFDVMDRLHGYGDGYFSGVMTAKFGRPINDSEEFPNQPYTRGYAAGLADATEITEAFSTEEKEAFGEGFGDSYVDSKNLCR